MKPHPATTPVTNGPDLQSDWSYWGLTMPTTLTTFDATGTKATVKFTPADHGVKPAKGMELENTRLF